MKTYVTHGLYLALAIFVLNLLLFLVGFHGSVEKLGVARWIGGIGALVATIVVIVLGTKARIAETPTTEPFGYGRSFLTGFMISLFGCLMSIVTNLIYFQVINPGLNDLIVQAQVAKAEAAGAPQAQIDMMEKMTRMMTRPIPQSIFNFVFGLVICTVIALVIAAIVKRPATEEPPVVA